MKENGTLLNGVNTLAVVCNQWGDTGKGKLVDLFADWANIIVRGTGGANAGHTVVVGDRTLVLHMIPSGILRDGDGKRNVIGKGTVFDPGAFGKDIEVLEGERLPYGRLLVSKDAILLLPQHILLDRLGGGRIGTTGRGIGPAYVDHYARSGLTVNDLLNPDVFVRKLKRNLRDKVQFLKTFDPEVVKGVLSQEIFGEARYWNPLTMLDADAIINQYARYAPRVSAMVCDTDELIRKAHASGARILLEGAQGALLGIDTGTYPFVTSSDPTKAGLAKGAGLHETDIDLTLGVVKACYMTRVGGGPFPTEMGGEGSAKWCDMKSSRPESERLEFSEVTVNDSNELRQGIAIRMRGNEYGATTGRARRVGWLDLPLLRHALIYNGPDIALTKLDVLDECEQIKICCAHEYAGVPYRLGRWIHRGDGFKIACTDHEVLSRCIPVYRTFPGWLQPIGGIRTYGDLPGRLKEIVSFVASETGARPRIVSVGSERDQTIVV